LKNVDCIYISGVLKHIGAGANLAFAVIPPSLSNIRPLLTGWLADVSVLSAGSEGVSAFDKVGYTPNLNLMGSTPSFTTSIILFNNVI
jgi:hypothetical protein